MTVHPETQAATDRIADQVRRLLTRETTFAVLCESIRAELTAARDGTNAGTVDQAPGTPADPTRAPS